jgi:uncharacterized membrane protein HdeD (DUF308 family)
MASEKMEVVVTVAGVVVSIVAAMQMTDHVRAVEIVTLFAGAFASGAAVTSLIHKRRARRQAPSASSGPP